MGLELEVKDSSKSKKSASAGNWTEKQKMLKHSAGQAAYVEGETELKFEVHSLKRLIEINGNSFSFHRILPGLINVSSIGFFCCKSSFLPMNH